MVQTLEEISNLVKDITLKLRDKKVLLQPQIKELKDSRKHFQEVENTYFQKRSTYEKVAVGLEVDRQQLEQVRRRSNSSSNSSSSSSDSITIVNLLYSLSYIVFTIQECDAFQEECLREESRYHYLNSLISIMDANLERVRTIIIIIIPALTLDPLTPNQHSRI